MLTIFSLPKPFKGHIKIIQDNAIQSWLRLEPRCEIILLGDDKGTRETAGRFHVRHSPDIVRNEYGTPLVSSVFNTGQSLASNDIVCYINADIILPSDFLPAVNKVMKKKNRFLIIGRRWDIDITKSVDFSNPDWELDIHRQIVEYGSLHGRAGLDYFVFPRALYQDTPPFAIGRTAWDNWLVYRARSLGAPVIDATQAVTAVHQNHDYSHNPEGTDGVWEGPEALRNRELAGGENHSFNIDHATWILTPKGMKRAHTIRRMFFCLEELPILHPQVDFLSQPINTFKGFLIAIRRSLGVYKVKNLQ